ncbi:hypothetical protein ACF09Y_21090 [Streptomyces massasporeus]|uniref:hypothetical protein n=1 Tax=Streptomyces massasporeus TaxID=67324 RepID=UPI003702008A
MAEDDGLLGPGRRHLKDGLGRLLQESGLTQAQAIRRANGTPGAATRLQKQTVSDWLAGSPPASFEPLWLLIQALLTASGREAPDDLRKAVRLAGEADRRTVRQALGAWDATRGYWEQVWRTARDEPGPAPDPRLRDYLTAARQAASTHPYPWPHDDLAFKVPPTLAEVYVHQESRFEPGSPSNPHQPGPHDASSSRPAAHVFVAPEPLCFLLAGPGGGKSTQARIHLAAAADRWLHRLNHKNSDRTDTAVPVLASATSLTGTTPLPQALAAAVAADLAEFGLLPNLNGFFDRHPIPKTPWLVIVDGLDEVPDQSARVRLLRALAAVNRTHPSLYRIIVLTRPLPTGELDALGPGTPRYALQPFEPGDLHGYARRCFRHLLSGRSPESEDEHAVAFMAQLARSRLDTLARTPLLAFMLTRLYAADPSRSLPNGRSAAYGAFIRLVYTQNSHKNVALIHAGAVRELADRYQEPADRRTAEEAGRRACNHLIEVIDYVAHQRFHGCTDHAAQIAARHSHAARPDSVDEHHWQRFLNDLLRPTGLLTQRGDDLDFFHQTVTEYLAARHATRNTKACAQLLDELFPPHDPTRIPSPDPSYLGFVLDTLLAAPGRLAAKTGRRLATVADRPAARLFLIQQVHLTTSLPVEPTARRLTQFAQDTALELSDRVEAARGLAEVDGYRDRGAELLTAFAEDSAFDALARVRAAWDLAEVSGYQDRGVKLLINFAENTVLGPHVRAAAARHLLQVDRYRDRAAELLTAFAEDPTFDPSARVQAAWDLAEVDRYQERAAELLTAFAEDPTFDASSTYRSARVEAAQYLTLVAGCQERAAELLAQLAEDPTLNPNDRTRAAQDLAKMDQYRDRSAELLTALAEDPAFDPSARVQAAQDLAGADGDWDHAAELLARLAEDTTLDASSTYRSARVEAAQCLTRVVGYQEHAAELLTAFAENPAFAPSARVQAAQCLTQVVGYQEHAAELLTAFAEDPAFDPYNRGQAARSMTKLGQYHGRDEDSAAEFLARLAEDTTINPNDRTWAARELAGVDGHRDHAAELLVQLAEDTTLDASSTYRSARVEAARELAWLAGYQVRGAELLTALAQDPTLVVFSFGFRFSARVEAARELARVDRCRARGAELLTSLAQDSTLDAFSFGFSARVEAAQELARLASYQVRGAELLIALAQDPILDPSARVWVARDLAGVGGYRDRAAELLARLAEDTTLDASSTHPSARVEAARELARLAGYQVRGAELLIALAQDPILDPSACTQAAQSLAGVDGYRERGVELLIAFAEDPAFDPSARTWAAQYLAGVVGYQEHAAELLTAFAEDSAFDPSARAQAAWSLAVVDGYRERGVELLIAFAEDSAFDPSARAQAAWDLSLVDGYRYRDRGAELLIAFAEDPAFDPSARAHAVRHLAWINGYWDRATAILAQLAEDSAVPSKIYRRVAQELAEENSRRHRVAELRASLADHASLDTRSRPSGAKQIVQNAWQLVWKGIKRRSSNEHS